MVVAVRLLSPLFYNLVDFTTTIAYKVAIWSEQAVIAEEVQLD